MPLETVLPAVPRTDAVRIQWPQPLGFMTDGASMFTTSAQGNVNVAWNLGAAGVPIWGGNFGAGAHQVTLHNRVITAEVGNSFIRGLDNGIVFPVSLRDDGQFAAGYRAPEYVRVFRMTIQMAADSAAAFTDASGIMWQGTYNGLPWPSLSGFGAFGITGDGVNSFLYRSYLNGAFPGNINETVAFPVGTITDLADFNTFVFEFINASRGRNAVFNLFVNGAPIVSRSWVAGSTGELHQYNSNETAWHAGIRCADAGRTLFVSSITYEITKFDQNGVEILF